MWPDDKPSSWCYQSGRATVVLSKHAALDGAAGSANPEQELHWKHLYHYGMHPKSHL